AQKQKRRVDGGDARAHVAGEPGRIKTVGRFDHKRAPLVKHGEFCVGACKGAVEPCRIGAVMRGAIERGMGEGVGIGLHEPVYSVGRPPPRGGGVTRRSRVTEGRQRILVRSCATSKMWSITASVSRRTTSFANLSTL